MWSALAQKILNVLVWHRSFNERLQTISSPLLAKCWNISYGSHRSRMYISNPYWSHWEFATPETVLPLYNIKIGYFVYRLVGPTAYWLSWNRFLTSYAITVEKIYQICVMFSERIHHGKVKVIHIKITSTADTWNSASRNKDVWRKDTL